MGEVPQEPLRLGGERRGLLESSASWNTPPIRFELHTPCKGNNVSSITGEPQHPIVSLRLQARGRRPGGGWGDCPPLRPEPCRCPGSSPETPSYFSGASPPCTLRVRWPTSQRVVSAAAPSQHLSAAQGLRRVLPLSSGGRPQLSAFTSQPCSFILRKV